MPNDVKTNARSGESKRCRLWRSAAGLMVLAAVILAANPAPALFLTTYGEFIQKSPEDQAAIVDAAIYEVIQYFVSTKRSDAKANCVGRYFSGSYGSDQGGYGDLKTVLEEMHDRYEAGTLGDGEDSYVERAVLKLIKEKCGV